MMTLTEYIDYVYGVYKPNGARAVQTPAFIRDSLNRRETPQCPKMLVQMLRSTLLQKKKLCNTQVNVS